MVAVFDTLIACATFLSRVFVWVCPIPILSVRVWSGAWTLRGRRGTGKPTYLYNRGAAHVSTLAWPYTQLTNTIYTHYYQTKTKPHTLAIYILYACMTTLIYIYFFFHVEHIMLHVWCIMFSSLINFRCLLMLGHCESGQWAASAGDDPLVETCNCNVGATLPRSRCCGPGHWRFPRPQPSYIWAALGRFPPQRAANNLHSHVERGRPSPRFPRSSGGPSPQ